MNIEKFFKYIKRGLRTKGRERPPVNIMAALLFGSWAQGTETPDSDVDLLVVASNINPKRHRRGMEIAYIKKCLPALSLDILLYTKGEVISNFRNHNPLFLDIAEEGIIILDDENFLQNLVSETRDYIKQKGIKKFGDGWIFPVEKGIPAFLSKVSNKDFSQAMLKDGERDFEIGKTLIEGEYYDKAVYHFQQSIEKSIKSILIAKGVFQKTHLIGRILRKVVSEKDIPKRMKKDLLEVADISEAIEPEVSLSRYPGIKDDSLWLPFNEYKKKDADGAMKKSAKALSVSKKFLGEWFSNVS
jgi:HEPN domain-containing protein/predicted nucleotidyltransferase